MDLSVIIVNYNAAPFLASCLTSLEQRLRGLTFEVCVVDNRSCDGSREILTAQFPWVKLVSCERNVGFAVGVNRGLEATSGRHVLWLNPDSVLLNDGFQALVRYLDDHPSVAVLGAKLLDSDGTIQLSCRSFPSYSAAVGHRYSLLTRWFPNNPWSRAYLRSGSTHSEIEDVDWVSGACLLHPRSLVSRIGRLDEQFFMYCEDVDFCLRARQAGLRVQYHPAAEVRHYIGASSRLMPIQMIVQRHRSMWLYYSKHFRRTLVGDCVVGAAIAARCGWLIMLGDARASVVMKRVLDVGLSGIGLMLSAPLWLLFAVVIKLQDGGPVFYRQARVGQGGRVFSALKFRSMLADAEATCGAIQATHNDPRVTPVGRLMRATAMDELPQLWNIFRGDMSFVGPRALRPGEIEVSGNGKMVPLEEVPGFAVRARVKPGLTGVAQIYAPRDIVRRNKFRYDRLYVRRPSLWLDMRLILLSFWITLRGTWEARGRKF